MLHGSFSAVVQATADATGQTETFFVATTAVLEPDVGNCDALRLIKAKESGNQYIIDTSATEEQTIEVTITGLSRRTSYDCEIAFVEEIGSYSTVQRITFRTRDGGGGVRSSSISSSPPTIEFEDAVDSPIVTDTPVSQPKQTFFVGQVSETIREAQEKLNETDCKVSQSGAGSPGQETTYLGSRTQQALRCFQNENNLPETGLLDEQTQEVLFEEETVPVQEVPEQTRQLIESLTRRINEIQTLLRRLLIERLREASE